MESNLNSETKCSKLWCNPLVSEMHEFDINAVVNCVNCKQGAKLISQRIALMVGDSFCPSLSHPSYIYL